MALERLVHHLRKHRKTVGLSQRELAHLLGWKSGERVSKYERFQSIPSLHTAMSCEIIFKRALSELLPGTHARSRKMVAFRATLLLDQIRASPRPRARRTVSFLETLADVSTH